MHSDAQSQTEQLKASTSMKQDEMRTELVDQLTTEEKDLMARLNQEITYL